MEPQRLNNILDLIVHTKKKRVEKEKKQTPLKKLYAQCENMKPPKSFLQAISVPNTLSIVAEMKKASPSAGLLVEDYKPEEIGRVYKEAGARALSILTEQDYFLGDPDHLSQVKKKCRLPLLRKDFIFDPYQIVQSKVLGASAILLIISILSKKDYLQLLQFSRDLNLDALVEVHSEEDLEIALQGNPSLIGINNRNLKDLTVRLETTFKLKGQIPKGTAIVAESGIRSPETVRELKTAGIAAALIGESVLRSDQRKEFLKTLVEAGQ
ncbi:MAG: indole-3-glycerol phosphate synthase TrpC [Elusimicrobia bacterium]|nr:indole-3-glycerol phosphate synthase TrpC [Elusimicrobiota bacterium]